MAEATEIGALAVKLGMDVAEFAKDARNAIKISSALIAKLSLIGGVAATVGAHIGKYLTDTFDGYVTSVKDAIEQTGEIEKAAKKFGVSLSEVTALIRDNGLHVSTFTDGMESLQESIFKVASGNATSDAARAFDAIGVSALTASGKMRPAGDVLKDIAEKFSTYKDGIARATLATDLFGKAGKDIADVLKLGDKAFEESADGGLDFSHVMADLYNSGLKKLKDAWDEGGKSALDFNYAITGGLQPSKDFAATIRDWGKAILDSLPSTAQIKGAFDSMLEAAISVDAGVQRLGVHLAGFWRAAKALFTDAEVAAVNDQTAAAIKKIDDSAAASLLTFKSVAAGWGAAAEDVKKASASATGDAPMKKSLKEIADAQKEWNKSVSEGVALVKQSEGPWTKYERQVTGLGAAFKDDKISVEEFALAQKKALDEANIAFAGGAGLIAKTTSPYQQMQVELQKLTEKYNAGAISATALGNAQRDATLTAASAYAGAASNIAGSLSTIFKKNKAVAIATGTIDAIGAALSAFKSVPYPLNYAAAAAAFAAGMVRVAAIRSTSEGGGGGGGGGGAASAPGLTQAPQQLIVQGINANQFYGGNQVFGILDAVNNAVQNGATLIATRVAA